MRLNLVVLVVVMAGCSGARPGVADAMPEEADVDESCDGRAARDAQDVASRFDMDDVETECLASVWGAECEAREYAARNGGQRGGSAERAAHARLVESATRRCGDGWTSKVADALYVGRP